MRDGFHDGELAVQDRAGVRAQAARLGQGMLAAPNLSAGMSGFLADREFAVLTARGEDGLWTSPIHAAPGFLEATDRTLRVHATPMGPALNIADGEPVGLLAIDFAGRRRVRVNGTVIAVAADGFDVAVDQAFGNCPRYIEQRRLVHAEPPVDARVVRSNALSADQVALITRSDTFFLGTVHPQRGADASHRGGPPGFVHVDGDRLWWPDYPGNNMFNSLGNLAVDPSAALLFIDFDTGATLHLSGSAVLDWSDAASDDGGTGRRVHFTVESVAAGTSALRGERLFSRRP